MNEIAAERSRDSPITSIKQNYLNLFYLFFDRPQVVPRLKLGKFTRKTVRNTFSASKNPHVLATHTRGTAIRQLLRRA